MRRVLARDDGFVDAGHLNQALTQGGHGDWSVNMVYASRFKTLIKAESRGRHVAFLESECPARGIRL